MELSENALKVLEARYLLKDEDGRVAETPEGMFRRVAATVARAERHYGADAALWEERFFVLMSTLRFLPNSPMLMNAGKSLGQLAACFVLPVDDSMGSIFETLKNAALILQSGGGTGFSFSHLRPKDDIVRSTGGIASGPVSFMKIYNTATDVIKQGGARRGANMGILRVDHPDIIDFIRVKRKSEELQNFNVSVAITDAFVDAVKGDEKFALLNPRSGAVAAEVKARSIFDEIVLSAWSTGDPGVVFIDRINATNPVPHIGEIESTNPCGEQPLLPYEACVLGSINLSKYVHDSKFDYGLLGSDVALGVRLLDDSIDVNKYPMQKIAEMHRGNRKVGLGVMGWADALISLGIPYASKEAFALARKVMGFITDSAREASAGLAREKGEFKNFKGSVYDKKGMAPLRNATLTTVAPTGTLSMIAGCSSGIEPLFALSYVRRVLETELFEENAQFFRMAREMGFYSEELAARVTKQGGLRGIKEVPPKIKKLFRTAHEISYEDHIEMQAAFQAHTDNAVSKTINLPRRARKDDVARAFMLAYDKGCKGVTVFRYGGKKTGTMIKLSDVD